MFIIIIIKIVVIVISFILAVITQNSFNMTRSVWNWQGKLQRNGDGEDGCFEQVGDFYHDSLRVGGPNSRSFFLLFVLGVNHLIICFCQK